MTIRPTTGQTIRNYAFVRKLLLSLIAAASTISLARSDGIGATLDSPAGKPAERNFLFTLSKVVGDGDLRDLDRFAKVLDSNFSLEPWYLTRENGNRRLERVAVVASTKERVFLAPVFRFTFAVQDSVPRTGALPRAIATMTFQMTQVGCLTRDDLMRQFGHPVREFPTMDGPGSSLVFLLGKSSDYQTLLYSLFDARQTCSLDLTVDQESLAP
jgi:hypothetical protein